MVMFDNYHPMKPEPNLTLRSRCLQDGKATSGPNIPGQSWGARMHIWLVFLVRYTTSVLGMDQGWSRIEIHSREDSYYSLEVLTLAVLCLPNFDPYQSHVSNWSNLNIWETCLISSCFGFSWHKRPTGLLWLIVPCCHHMWTGHAGGWWQWMCQRNLNLDLGLGKASSPPKT